MSAVRYGRRALAVGALAGGFLAGGLGLATDQALAAYGAQVQNGILRITGNNEPDRLALRLDPSSPGTLELDVGADGIVDFAFDRATFTQIAVSAGGGNDEVTIDESHGAFADEGVVIDGGDGADTLVGGRGRDVFIGGAGTDTVDGNQGDDVALLGADDDRVVWNPGDGDDIIEGQDGTDALDFNGGNVSEVFDVFANGGRVLFIRNVATVVMDLNDVERLNLHTLGGTDFVTVGDLSGTDLTTAAIDLGADAKPDTITALGTSGRDVVTVAKAGAEVRTSGLAAGLRITGSEPALDTLRHSTLAGNDSVTVGATVNQLIKTVVDLGPDELVRPEVFQWDDSGVIALPGGSG